jgi:hypothetical protein
MSQVNTARLGAGFAKTLNTSLEENDVNININAETEGGEQETPEVVETASEVDVDAVPLDTSETPEASELEVQEVQAEGDAVANDVEELDNSLDSLESIYFTLANVAAEGMEITPAFARMTHVAVDNAVGRFGLTTADCGVASVESIELAPNAEIETSMEGIAETLKAGASQLGALLDKLIANLVEFLKSILTGAGRTESRLNAVDKAVREHKGAFGVAKVPAVLDGNIKAGDLGSILEVGKALVTTKYADLAVLAKQADLTADQVSEAVVKSTRAFDKVKGTDALPGYTIGRTSEGAVSLERREGTAKEVQLSQSEILASIGVAKNMVKVAKDYDSAKGVRKQVSESIKGSIKEATADEKGLARLSARRKLVKIWTQQVNVEQRIVGTIVGYANAVGAAAASTLRKADKKAEA